MIIDAFQEIYCHSSKIKFSPHNGGNTIIIYKANKYHMNVYWKKESSDYVMDVCVSVL